MSPTKNAALRDLDSLLEKARQNPATEEELAAQREGMGRYTPGPRQAQAMRPTHRPTPRFVTFTGIDDRTNLAWAHNLSRRYPIEWGCLIGGKLGKNRYPRIETIENAGRMLSTALHVCKDEATFVNNGGLHPDSYGFDRIQVNMPAQKYNIPMLEFAAAQKNHHIIMQTRTGFAEQPEGSKLFQLFDQSGGRGKMPTSYPAAPDERLVGYAGGINPQNVEAVLYATKAQNFWLDMESGVRDSGDWLDLEKCEAVCRVIWGDHA